MLAREEVHLMDDGDASIVGDYDAAVASSL